MKNQIAAFLIITGLSLSQASALEPRRPPPHVENELCKKASVSRIQADGVSGFDSGKNYCAEPSKNLPMNVLGLLKKVEGIHLKIASLLGSTLEQTFVRPVEIRIEAYSSGSMASYASDEGIHLTVLPSWQLSDFASMVYAHEIMHYLSLNPGSFSRTIRGLDHHPFFFEALPDLISTAIFDSPQMKVGERELPTCLRIQRDESPIKSLKAPFQNYYAFAGSDSVLNCCAKLRPSDFGDLAAKVCRETKDDRSEANRARRSAEAEKTFQASAYTDANLQTSFSPTQCRKGYLGGVTTLENCDFHQFAHPLVSFFFRLKKLTGRPLVSSFLKAVRDRSETSVVFDCGYVRGTRDSGDERAQVALRPLLPSFVALRESLGPLDQKSFDQAWKEHGMERFVDLDHLFRTETEEWEKRFAVQANNSLYNSRFHCENSANFAQEACRVSCQIVEKKQR
ncbi:MAG: hypothetical protein H7301_07855 [Cryobacterium sp.]|nr:hypothetical protein [Oligoflexia bacterium]